MNNREIRIERANAPSFTFQNLELTLLVRPHDTGGRLAIQKVMTLSRTTLGPIRFNESDVTLFVVDGEIELRYGNQRKWLRRHATAFIPRGNGFEMTCSPACRFIQAFSPGIVQDAFYDLARVGVNPLFSDEGKQELRIWGVEHHQGTDESKGKNNSETEPIMLTDSEEGERYWMAGDEYTIKINGSQTSNRFCLVHFLIPPGGGPIPHIHLNDEEVFHVLTGEVQFYANGSLASGHTGDTAILPRGIPHAFRNSSSQHSEFLTFVTPSGFDDFVRSVGKPAIGTASPPTPDAEEIERLFGAAFRFGVKLLPEISW